MPPESLPQISLGTAALVIFLLCFGFVFLRGIVRMLFGVAILGGSLWVGFLVWQKTPERTISLMGKPVDWISIALPAVAFVGTFVIARVVINFFLKPFKPSADGGSRTAGGILFRLILTIIPTGFLWLIGATLVHHFGSIAEIEQSTDKKTKAEPGLLDRFSELKEAIAAIVPADWLQKLDPLADPSHLSLAKLIAAQPDSRRAPVIDPETGKPYPRAIIVDEPELQDLASDGRISTLIRHPLFQKALNDPKVREALRAQAVRN
ncbi:MAG: CvpA family protein [Akkermansiaceae bacterium]|nr:CvpA family protein [Akkermansiaceae bacterium]